MDPKMLSGMLTRSHDLFKKSTSSLQEEDSTFAPAEGLFTTAQMIAHVAHTVDWFMEGAFRPEGFDLDMETIINAPLSVMSVAAAFEWADRAFASATQLIAAKSEAEMMAALPEGVVMGGEPRWKIIYGIEDHTAHHRGALTVYARLCGRVPPMPYV